LGQLKNSLQNILVPRKTFNSGNLLARVLFNNEAQTTLVKDNFGKRAGWNYTPAEHTLVGV